MAKNGYDSMDRDALIAEIEALKKRKKFGLVWEDKPEQVLTDCEHKLPVLQEVKTLAINTDEDKPTNLLIEGDNYHALSVLNYTHGGKIDVIYIDPPYNTGAKDWQYNNDYVDKEDGYRHSKWLSMMENRLRLAKNLLTDSGFICCAIDHNELFTLGCLMDEIFGEANRIGVVTVVHKVEGRLDGKFFATSNEYVLVYAKNADNAVLLNTELTQKKIDEFNLEDEVGNYKLKQLRRAGSNSNREDARNMFFPIYYNSESETFSLQKSDDAIEILPINPRGDEKVWRWGSELTGRKLSDLVYKKTNNRHDIYLKARLEDYPGERATTVWYKPKYSAASATNLITQMIGRGKFAYPKSVYAVMDFIKITSKPNSVVLDFFAGSGTTGHAVAMLNKEDGGSRRFILCTNNENGIAREVCQPRIKAVIKGNDKLPEITKIPFNLRYYKTAFVDSCKVPTDQDKARLTQKSAKMICVKEGTFAVVKDLKTYKIFRNKDRYTAIIYNESAIDNFKKCAAKINGKIAAYIFSLGDDDYADEFADMRDKIRVCAIPEAILRVYRQIFNKKGFRK